MPREPDGAEQRREHAGKAALQEGQAQDPACNKNEGRQQRARRVVAAKYRNGRRRDDDKRKRKQGDIGAAGSERGSRRGEEAQREAVRKALGGKCHKAFGGAVPCLAAMRLEAYAAPQHDGGAACRAQTHHPGHRDERRQGLSDKYQCGGDEDGNHDVAGCQMLLE